MAAAAPRKCLALLCELESLMEAAALLAHIMDAELRGAAVSVSGRRPLSAGRN